MQRDYRAVKREEREEVRAEIIGKIGRVEIIERLGQSGLSGQLEIIEKSLSIIAVRNSH